MKKLFCLVITGLLLIVTPSCEEKGGGVVITALEVETDKFAILDDGKDAITVSVRDQAGRDITGEVEILVGERSSGSRITSTEPGSYPVTALYGDIVSEPVVIEVVVDPGYLYAKRLLIEQFTATWCGWCPRAISAVKDATTVDRELTHIAYHIDDEFSYSLNTTLFRWFGFTGIPSMAADRSIVWRGLTTELNPLHKPVRAGMSLEVGGNDSRITVNLEIHSGVEWTLPLKVAVYLVEDDLVADQKNFYNDDPSSGWYQAGAVLNNFVHENVMRATLTDLYGAAIPSDSIGIGTTYRLSYTVDAGLVEDSSKSEVVALLLYGGGAESGTVINTLSCSFGESASNTSVAGDR